MMDYQATLNYLFSQLPMFQRQGATAFKKDLSNTIELCRLLDDPQQRFKSIHVGGTNGKGSVSHMLAAVFQAAGYKVGLYTSPHLRDFRERIRINGEMIPEATVIRFVEQHRSDFERINPSFFEMTVSLAFHHFAQQKVDLAIVEVGMGGRLDSTNVLTPELSVITNIGYDHQQFLGETLPEIAREKAGIIKPNVPVVIGEFQQEVAEVFETKARESKSLLRFADREWGVRDTILYSEGVDEHLLQLHVRHYDGPELELEAQLTGPHQRKNLITVLETVRTLTDMDWNVTRDHFKEGVRTVVDRTGLLGRWQVLQREPLIIADTAHNKEGLLPNLNRLLSNRRPDQLHFVWGMVNDKDISGVLQLLPQGAHYYFCSPNVPRGLEANMLATAAAEHALSGSVHGSVQHALEAAKKLAGRDDIIYIGGSTFVVAEVV